MSYFVGFRFGDEQHTAFYRLVRCKGKSMGLVTQRGQGAKLARETATQLAQWWTVRVLPFMSFPLPHLPRKEAFTVNTERSQERHVSPAIPQQEDPKAPLSGPAPAKEAPDIEDLRQTLLRHPKTAVFAPWLK